MHSDILEIMGVGAKLPSKPRYGVRPDDISLWLVTFRHGFPFFGRCDLTRKYLNLMHREYRKIRNRILRSELIVKDRLNHSLITVCVTSFTSKGLVSSISFLDIFLAQTGFVGV